MLFRKPQNILYDEPYYQLHPIISNRGIKISQITGLQNMVTNSVKGRGGKKRQNVKEKNPNHRVPELKPTLAKVQLFPSHGIVVEN